MLYLFCNHAEDFVSSLWEALCKSDLWLSDNHRFEQTYEQSEWVIHIAGRLLANDTAVLSLLDHNPFQGRDPPRWTHTHLWEFFFSQLLLFYPTLATASERNFGLITHCSIVLIYSGDPVGLWLMTSSLLSLLDGSGGNISGTSSASRAAPVQLRGSGGWENALDPTFLHWT